jgi:nucleoside-diphosphate-sugar epimerase
MKILITAVTGYIGAAVREALARAGHHAVAFDSSLIAAADAIVWTAMSDDPEIDEAAIDSTLEAIRMTGKAFVFTSGAWVHGDTHGRVVDETAHLHPLPLVGWRADLERHVLETPGIRAVVIRPGIVYGHGGGIPAMLVASARRDGVVRMPGDGSNHWPVVHVDDLSDLYVRAIEHAPAGAVLLAVHRTETFRDVAAAASDAAGAAGKVVAWPLEDARRALGDVADALAADQQLASRRATQLLGWRPSHVDLLTDLRAGSYRHAGVRP